MDSVRGGVHAQKNRFCLRSGVEAISLSPWRLWRASSSSLQLNTTAYKSSLEFVNRLAYREGADYRQTLTGLRVDHAVQAVT
jgi:hypothetical protein